jgi:hypothetical protein
MEIKFFSKEMSVKFRQYLVSGDMNVDIVDKNQDIEALLPRYVLNNLNNYSKLKPAGPTQS